MEFFTHHTKPSDSEVYSWMHCRPNDVTTKNINVIQGIDMRNNQISNLNMNNLRANLPSFRWFCQSTHNPPLEGEIYLSGALNGSTLLINKKCNLDRTVNNIVNWTTVTITDVDKSIIYECSLSNWQTSTNYFSVQVLVNSTIGTPSTPIGSILEIKYTMTSSPSSNNDVIQYKFIGGFPISEVDTMTISAGEWYIDLATYNLLFSKIDSNENTHTDILSKIGFNSIICINMANGKNRYYCITQTVGSNYVVFKYDNSLSSSTEGTLTVNHIQCCFFLSNCQKFR